MMKERLAIIIATKDRPHDLCHLLENISNQSIKPSQVIIVDSSEAYFEQTKLKMFSLDIDYVYERPPSLTAQRNKGIKVLRDDITLVCFLDDDLRLLEGSLKNMMDFWEVAPQEVGGVSFNIINEPYKSPTFFERIFCVSAVEPNKMLKSGFQGKISFVKYDIPAEWIVGCAMVFRKKIFNEFMFDEWFSGYARYEDVDFSYRVGKKYKMFVVAQAMVDHADRLENVKNSFALGKMEVINRLYFVKKNKDLSLILCYWGLFGIFLNNVIKGLLMRNKRYIYRAKGNAAGFLNAIFKI